MKPHSLSLSNLNLQAIDAIAIKKHPIVDSRKVQHGDVFLAFKGENSDGRDYIAAAIAAGAQAILWDPDHFSWPPQWHLPNLAIPNLRLQAGIIAAHLQNYPSRTLHTIGITGTNGKTSTAYWLTEAFDALSEPGILIGTLGNGAITELTATTLTTPDAATVQTLMTQYLQRGARHVSMEVSSHALAQGRVHGIAFNIAVFTNLTRDHLDYHHSMQAYAQAKSLLFEWEGLEAIVVNADDPFSTVLLKKSHAPTRLRYGIKSGEVRAHHIEYSASGTLVKVTTPWGNTELISPALGQFQVYNLLAALSVLLVSGFSLQKAIQALMQVKEVRGRMQKAGGQGKAPLAIIDYAHTPDALEKVLSALRAHIAIPGKLYCVFGCGGDRDRGKRALMGSVAARLTDVAIITNDNPRSEEPQQIINDIINGFPNGQHFVVKADREQAISYAIGQAQLHDIVLIAGKGHESYQEIAGVRYAFNDMAIVKRCLADWQEHNMYDNGE